MSKDSNNAERLARASQERSTQFPRLSVDQKLDLILSRIAGLEKRLAKKGST